MKLLREYKTNRRQEITETHKKMLFSYKNKVLQLFYLSVLCFRGIEIKQHNCSE